MSVEGKFIVLEMYIDGHWITQEVPLEVALDHARQLIRTLDGLGLLPLLDAPEDRSEEFGVL